MAPILGAMFFGRYAISTALRSGDEALAEQFNVTRYCRNRAGGASIWPPSLGTFTFAQGLQLLPGLLRLPLRASRRTVPPFGVEVRWALPQYAKSWVSNTSLVNEPVDSNELLSEYRLPTLPVATYVTPSF